MVLIWYSRLVLYYREISYYFSNIELLTRSEKLVKCGLVFNERRPIKNIKNPRPRNIKMIIFFYFCLFQIYKENQRQISTVQRWTSIPTHSKYGRWKFNLKKKKKIPTVSLHIVKNRKKRVFFFKFSGGSSFISQPSIQAQTNSYQKKKNCSTFFFFFIG